MKDIKKIFEKGGGCQIVQPHLQDAQYEIVFGGELPQEPINWEMHLPEFERQGNTTGCVSFSRLNCAETLAKREGLSLNLSDRHLFVLSGTTKAGNNLNAVSEAFRTLGIVREEFFPWKSEMLEDQSAYWQEIFDTSSIPADARRFFGGNHSWIKEKEAMKSALAFSPLQIAIPIYETYFMPNNIIKKGKDIQAYHAVECYWIDEQGNYHIFDSAGGEKKILDKDYPIIQTKSFRDLPEDWKSITPQEKKTALEKLLDLLKSIAQMLGLLKSEQKKAIETIQEVIDEVKTETDKILLWDTPQNARHSARVIMDTFHLSWAEKDLLCRVLNCESGFNTKAIHKNPNGTYDYGIAQINSAYWIGLGKYFKSPEEVLNFPEKSIKFLCEQYKKGNLKYWACFKSKLYLKYS